MRYARPKPNRNWPLCACALAALSGAIGACANPTDPEVESQPEALMFDPSVLNRGHARVLVDGIQAAENLLFTSTGRLFVSGDDGIFEIVGDAGGNYRALPLHTGESCHFGGMTEEYLTVYANCYDMNGGNSSVFAAALTAKPDFKMIQPLPGIALANGLTSDGAGNLYIAATIQGEIIHLQMHPGDPLRVDAQDQPVQNPGLFANGIKFFGTELYWTNFTNIEAFDLSGRRLLPTPRTLFSAPTFFDDLYVDASGILAADALNGSIAAGNLRGEIVGGTPSDAFDGPSAVSPALGRLGLPRDALVVTERNGNNVSVFEP